ncbi:hypothetical protein C5Z26_04080 [Lactobacillus sp. CBA3606]|uniref:polysaccharide pyruvyl transferase family protein n=1 Tax=Lactobacillus sp. CBA3606 TaxID=2099789 RepID=UPI000CFDCF8E|nr:polysaccharide pyruvyl transferase family protein [Lactobacillus sp. CBA3606]AVK63326.1 hypothetical protein C5Z26_04080 [Lactobacillus sp. CBA3606]
MEKKISISGYFVQNIGDDLFLLVLTQMIPNIEFRILNYSSPDFHEYYEKMTNIKVVKNALIKKLTLFLPTKLLAHLYCLFFKRNDVFVLLGGSIFIETAGSANLLKYRRFNQAISLHTFVIGSNFGPYSSETFMRSYEDFLSSVEGVTWRDKTSFQLFKHKDVQQKLLPDVVLGLDVDNKDINPFNNQYVLVNVMNLKVNSFSDELVKSYFNRLKTFISIQLELGMDVHLLSVNVKDGDLEAATSLKVNNFGNNEAVSVVNYEDISSTLQEFEFAESVIATRYHAMILSWLYGKPVHVLAYSDKIINFIKTWNVEQVYTDLRASQRQSALEEMTFSEIDQIKLKELHDLAKQHFDDLKSVLKNK